MATYESIATATNEDDGDLLTIAKPSGLAAGNLMVALLSVTQQNLTWSLSGWTELFRIPTALGNSTFSCLFKVADSGDAAATDFTFTHENSSTQSRAGAIVRISGTFSGAGNLAYDSDAVTSDATPTYPTGVTPPGTSALLIMGAVLAAVQTASDYAVTNNNPSWTERADISKNGAEDVAISIATGSYAASSSTGDYSLTLSGATDSRGYIIAISDNENVSVSPAVVTMAASIQAPSITGGALVSPAVVTMNASIQAPTVTTAEAEWKNTDKSSTPSWVNPDKS